MGGRSSQTQNTLQTSRADPYAPAQGTLQTILSQVGGINADGTAREMGALDRLAGRAAAGNPYAAAIGGVATELLGGGPDRTGMVNDAYGRYIAATNPTAAGDFLDPNKSPFFAGTTNAIADDAVRRITGMYAGSGRDPSGAGSVPLAVAEGVAKGTAPVFASAWNTERGRQLDAINGQLSAAGQSSGWLSTLDQARLGRRQAGIAAADAANNAANWGDMQALFIEAQRRNIPLQALAAMMGIVLPAAQAFGTKTVAGNTRTDSEMSGADQFLKIASGLGGLLSRVGSGGGGGGGGGSGGGGAVA